MLPSCSSVHVAPVYMYRYSSNDSRTVFGLMLHGVVGPFKERRGILSRLKSEINARKKHNNYQ